MEANPLFMILKRMEKDNSLNQDILDYNANVEMEKWYQINF